MAVFTIWEHDKFAAARQERAVVVRDGYAFWATVFGPLWLLANGMIVVLIAYLIVVGGSLAAVTMLLGETAAFPISLVLSVWFGFEARALRRWSLARRGWVMATMVEAPNAVEAERRAFAVEPPAERVVTPVSVPQHPVPGVFPEALR